MFVGCKKCGYDSGDCDTDTQLVEKIVADGGKAVMTFDGENRPNGLEIVCPNGHAGGDIHLD